MKKYLTIFYTLAFIAATQTSFSQNIDGDWKITEARDIAGKQYGGRVSFEFEKNFAYNIKWDAAGSIYKGVGIYVANSLYGAYGINGGGYGIVVYTIQPGNTLTGTWTASGLNGLLGTETVNFRWCSIPAWHI